MNIVQFRQITLRSFKLTDFIQVNFLKAELINITEVLPLKIAEIAETNRNNSVPVDVTNVH